MKNLSKILTKTALVAGLAVAGFAAFTPANAGVSIGVGLGVPVAPAYSDRFCYNHPGACAAPVADVGVAVAPTVGVYYAGHGYWDGHRYWDHRVFFHGGWRYR